MGMKERASITWLSRIESRAKESEIYSLNAESIILYTFERKDQES